MTTQPLGPSQPTIGRIVHVVLEPIAVPAIVTAVTSSDGEIMCTAFPPGSPPLPLTGIAHYEPAPGTVPAAGSWHWPPLAR